jgi:hypothetical protein
LYPGLFLPKYCADAVKFKDKPAREMIITNIILLTDWAEYPERITIVCVLISFLIKLV